MRVVIVEDPDQAGGRAARLVARWLHAAVSDRGTASVAFSGGAAPLPMFAALASCDVPWSEVEIFQVDERVAPDGHPDRNAVQLSGLPVARRRLHLMPVTAADLDGAARRYAKSLPPRLDVVVLGVGDDGHTASWPPGDPVVEAVEAVRALAEFNGRRRMTLTPVAVNGARRRLMLAPGADKAGVVAGWLAGDPTLSVSRVRRTSTTVVLDTASASALPTRPS